MMIKPEFSREYEVTRLTEGETELILEATVDERAKLAQRFNLEAITALRAKSQVTVDSSEGLIDFAGIIEADITQACVVSLKPIQTHVEAQISRRYTTISIPLDSPKEVDLNKENDDVPLISLRLAFPDPRRPKEQQERRTEKHIGVMESLTDYFVLGVR